jgi:hypothetical protein
MDYQSITLPSNRYDNYVGERNALPIDARDDVYYNMFRPDSIKKMSQLITARLRGVHPLGLNIIVPDQSIVSVMDSFWHGYKRDSDLLPVMTVAYIVDYIKSEYQIEEQNRDLTAWVSIFPQSNGLRQHAPIKLRERRPTNFQFHYSY